MAGKRSYRYGNVISLSTASMFRDSIVVWFANAATSILLATPIQDVSFNILSNIVENLQSLLDELAEVTKNKSREELYDWVPIPLTPNDKRELMTVGNAIKMLHEAIQGRVEVFPLPPALSLEYSEYVRVFMPYVRESLLKRNTVAISSEMLGLAIVGAMLTYTYRAENEWGYVFLDLYNPAVVDMAKLNRMAKRVVSSVKNGDGSTLSVYVGVASTLVLNLGKMLNTTEGHGFYTSVRITKSGNKTMLKAFEIVDMTSLAKTIMRLGIAGPLYTLISSYPHRDKSQKLRECRAVRSFIESMSRALITYHSIGDPEELYKVLRRLTSEEFNSLAGRCLEGRWDDASVGLLKIVV